MHVKVGDEITIEIKHSTDDKQNFVESAKVQIIGLANDENNALLCYVPPHQHLTQTFKITNKHRACYGFDRKFLNERGIYISDLSMITKFIPCAEGEKCTRCGTFVEWAIKDGEADYLCYACRKDPWR